MPPKFFPDDFIPAMPSRVVLSVGKNVTKKEDTGCLVWRGSVVPSGPLVWGTYKPTNKRRAFSVRAYLMGHTGDPSFVVSNLDDCYDNCINPEHMIVKINTSSAIMSDYTVWYIRYVEFGQNDQYPNIRPRYTNQDIVIAKKYGVGDTAIRNIRLRNTFKHIKEDSFERVD